MIVTDDAIALAIALAIIGTLLSLPLFQFIASCL